ncbi:MAG: hypothetical protein ACRC7B_03005 [Metamycoplasmataceae bacterium]
MISNLKKIALGIMSTGGILVPLAVVASCSSETKDEDLKITAKSDPTVILTDIQGENWKSLATLQKLFNGITQSDLDNVIVTKSDISEVKYVITLTAKSGYTISGQEKLELQFTLSIELDMTAKVLDPYQIKEDDVDNDAFKSYATLQKLFQFDTAKIDEELLHRAVVVTMTPMTGNQPRVVTLTANKGYALNGMPILDSNTFVIPINYVINQTAIVPTDIKPSDLLGDNYKMWPVVSKLFTGPDFNEDMLENLVIELITITEGQTYQIKLTPLTDFEINGGTTGITSEAFNVLIINLDITIAVSNPQDITLKNLQDGALIHSKDFLEKLFELGTLEQTVIDNVINVEFVHIAGTQYRIKLTVKSIDYRINGATTLESNPFNIVQNINITRISPVIADVSTFDLRTPDALKSLNTLQKVFNIEADQDLIDRGLVVRINDLLDPLVSIGLQARSGYIIDNGLTNVQNITSDAFPELTGIEGLPRTTALSPTPPTSDDVIDNLHSMETLSNFFDGLTPEILANDITAVLNTLENGFSTITLRANDGKTFRTGREITSIEFKYFHILDIFRIDPIIQIPTASDISPANLMTLPTMNKLFNNFTDADLTKVTARVGGTNNARFVVLTGIDEWHVFRNGSSTQTGITSDIFTPLP